MKKLIILFLLFVLSGCGGAYVDNIQYSKSSDTLVQKPISTKTITVTTFADSRVDYPETDKRIGRLVGGLGDTLRSIEIPQSLSVVVSDITTELLKDAGYKANRTGDAPSDGLTLSGDILQFYAMFFYAHKVAIEIDLTLTDNTTKEKVWSGKASNYFGGSLFERYPQLKEDPTIGCLGFDCHAKGVHVAMNTMLLEALREAWDSGGMKAAVDGL